MSRWLRSFAAVAIAFIVWAVTGYLTGSIVATALALVLGVSVTVSYVGSLWVQK